MADYPARGTRPWDIPLRDYIVETVAESTAGSSTDAGVAYQLVNGEETQTALGDAIEADSSPGTLAYAENVSSVPTTATLPPVPIPGTIITVPAIDKDVFLEWGAFFANTGSTFPCYGPLYCLLYELTNGVPVGLSSSLVHQSLGTNYITASMGAGYGQYRVGPADHDRVYGLYAAAVTEGGGGTLVCQVLNIPSGRTYLRAVA